MQVLVFHLMPYKPVPDDFAERWGSAWVTLPNEIYAPEEGRRVYEEALAELVAAEALGFDGVAVNEHHQNAYGTMPSPNIMAAWLAARTSRVRIAVLGNALPLRANPLRIAEEVAMLDLLSGGRIVSGFVRGIGAEYHSFGVDPTTSHDRFHEAHDLIVRAWTEPGPFRWEGRHYHLPYVNPWTRPLQRPHPPIWIPSQGSTETVRWAAEHGYTYLQTFSPFAAVKRYIDMYHAETRRAHGRDADPGQVGWAVPVFVGPTDAEARAQAKPFIEFFYNRLLRMSFEFYFPPGYLTPASMAGVLQAKRGLTSGDNTIDELIESGRFICGDADTVYARLAEAAEALRLGALVGVFQFAKMPHGLALENLRRFAEGVLPRLHALPG